MNVTHICTYDSGGAGTAALRLHSALSKRDKVNSNFLCLYKTVPNKDVVQFTSNNGFLTKIIGKYLRRSKDSGKLMKKFPESEILSLPYSNFDILDHPLIKQADIINLHWVSRFLDYPSFFKNVRKKTVWTLHDMNPILGIVHYKNELDNNAELTRFDDKIKLIKKKAFVFSEGLHIISPSKWLKEQAIQSHQFSNSKFYHIQNGVDKHIFSPSNKNFARSVFSLNYEKITFIFISENLSNIRKGFNLLIDSLSYLDDIKDKIQFLVIGNYDGTVPVKNNMILAGRIHDERLMSIALSAGDACIIPSIEDNLPNVMIESLMVGTPVIGFAVGGIKETIKNTKNGILSEEIDSKSLANAIREFSGMISEYNRKEIRESAIQYFDLDLQAKRYEQLYSDII